MLMLRYGRVYEKEKGIKVEIYWIQCPFVQRLETQKVDFSVEYKGALTDVRQLTRNIFIAEFVRTS